jgi:hypothetical protein
MKYKKLELVFGGIGSVTESDILLANTTKGEIFIFKREFHA